MQKGTDAMLSAVNAACGIGSCVKVSHVARGLGDKLSGFVHFAADARGDADDTLIRQRLAEHFEVLQGFHAMVTVGCKDLDQDSFTMQRFASS